MRPEPLPNLERRTFAMDSVRVEPSAAQAGTRIVGHAAIFDLLSEDLGGFRERIKPGAFAEVIGTDDVRAHFNHDENIVLGRTKPGTLRLEEDAVGLRFEIDPPDTQAARDLLVSIQREDVDQVSFAFQVRPEGEEWRKEKDGWVRTIRKFSRLWDVSPVTYAAYPATDVALRGLRTAVAAQSAAGRGAPEGRAALPAIEAPTLGHRANWRVPEKALERWMGLTRPAAARADEAVISILDPIGDPFAENPVTAKSVAAALRMIGADRDVLIRINSPGGDLFEGIAIYNLLREHKGRVTTRVIGLAASAASLIAMAGDARQVARASFMMIHNVWVLVIGNRNDLREVADQLEPFDRALADVYVRRSGNAEGAVRAMMDAETWFSGDEAIERGFADELSPADAEPQAAADEEDGINEAANRLQVMRRRQRLAESSL